MEYNALVIFCNFNGSGSGIDIIGIAESFERIGAGFFAEQLRPYKLERGVHGVGRAGHRHCGAARKPFALDILNVEVFAVGIVFRIKVKCRAGDLIQVSFAGGVVFVYLRFAYAAYSTVGHFDYYPHVHVAAKAARAVSMYKVVAVVHKIYLVNGSFFKLRFKVGFVVCIKDYLFDVAVGVYVAEHPVQLLFRRHLEQVVAEGEQHAAHENYGKQHIYALEGGALKELFHRKFLFHYFFASSFFFSRL